MQANFHELTIEQVGGLVHEVLALETTRGRGSLQNSQLRQIFCHHTTTQSERVHDCSERIVDLRKPFNLRLSDSAAGCRAGMAYGLSDSDFEDYLETTSSDDNDQQIPFGLSLPAIPPAIVALTATAAQLPFQSPSGDASRTVPPNRQDLLMPVPCGASSHLT